VEDKKLTFKITDEKGKEVEYEELYSFKNEETGKNYMVYTDNTTDEDGSLRIYASIYNPDKDDNKLIPIENDEEWAFVEETIDALQGEGDY